MTLEPTSPWCIWFKHHPKDFALETQGFEHDEVAAYVRLRDRYFANGGSLPADETILARIAEISDEDWPRCRRMLLTLFKIVNGVWTHPRLDKAIADSIATFETNSANGKKGAEARLKGRSSPAQAKPTESDSDSESESDNSNNENTLSADEQALYEREFDELWGIYPFKQAKQRSLSQFVQVRASGVSLELLKRGLQHYIDNKPQKQSYCHLSTWLGEERWHDCPESPSSSAEARPEPPDDSERRKVFDLLGPSNYQAWFADADFQSGKIIIKSNFRRDHVIEHFGDQLRKIGFSLSDGLEIPAHLDRRVSS